MGEVVRLAKDGEEQFIVQPYGWEKGIMVKENGKESMNP